MARIITEKKIVVVLFLMVVITFSFAHKDTEKIEYLYRTSAIKSTSPAIAIYKADQTLSFAGAIAVPN